MLTGFDHFFAALDGGHRDFDVALGVVIVAAGEDADALLGGNGRCHGSLCLNPWEIAAELFDRVFRAGDEVGRGEGFGDLCEVAAEVGDFLGAFIDEQNNQFDIGMVAENGGTDVFEKRGFAGFGWRDDEGALAAADGAEEVDESATRGAAGIFECESRLWVDGSEVLEASRVSGHGERFTIDIEDDGCGALIGLVCPCITSAAAGVATAAPPSAILTVALI